MGLSHFLTCLAHSDYVPHQIGKQGMLMKRRSLSSSWLVAKFTSFFFSCQEVLSTTTTLGHQWLLHSPPPSLHGETSLLSSLIESCVDPPPGVLRKNVAAQIIQTIDQALLEKC